MGIYFTENDVKAQLKAVLNIDYNSKWDSDNEHLIVQNIRVSRKTANYCQIFVSYAVSQTGYFQPTVNPLQLPWRFLWEPVTEPVPFDRDIDNNPILNAAYDPPSNPATKNVTYWCLRVQSFEAFFDYATYKTYLNTVNSDTITLTQPNGNNTAFTPGTIYHLFTRPTRDYTANDKFLPVERVFHIYDLSQINITDPFQLHFLNAGSSAFYGTDGAKGNIVFADGSTPAGDVPLDAVGKPINTKLKVSPATAGGDPQAATAAPKGLPKGATVENTGNTDFPAVFLRYKRYKSMPLLPILTPPSNQ